jgi:hypothetical protein
MVASILTFFQVCKSSFPAFSIAVLISSKSLPILDTFSINLATGEFAHHYFCIVNATISNVFSLSHEISVDFEAALIAIKRSK